MRIIDARALFPYQLTMSKERCLLTGLAGLGLFAAGYLAGQQDLRQGGGNPSRQAHAAGLPDQGETAGPLQMRTKSSPSPRPAAEKQTGYRKIVEMVSKGELRIDGVSINSENFLPGDKVAEFFGLSEDELAKMKQLGLERLQEKQRRELSLAKVSEVSGSGMVVDLPDDPEFAATEAARFTEDIHQNFGPDVAAMLQKSIEGVYGDLDSPRHVRYSLTRRDDLANLPINAPQEIRAIYGEMYDYKLSINCNEDGSFMANEQECPERRQLIGGHHEPQRPQTGRPPPALPLPLGAGDGAQVGGPFRGAAHDPSGKVRIACVFQPATVADRRYKPGCAEINFAVGEI